MMFRSKRPAFLPPRRKQKERAANPDDIRKLTAFFAWTAWTATANRPGKNYSYTNNWPPEPLAGNTITAGTVT